jgi:arginine N-succinyltransferase
MDANFLIRNAEPRDLADLHRLSRYLDSYNLPADRGYLKRLIDDSIRSFKGQLPAPEDGRYLFILEDVKARKAVGCSMVVAKHGRPGMPHLYMTVFTEERTSITLKKTVRHRCLRLGTTEDGPTEVGGLVLLPAYRGRREGLGAWLSYVRLLYVAAHPENFQNSLLAEYMPRFLKGRTSPFWEYVGRKFTGLTYKKADRLSIDNKEFILSLFPRNTLYLDFFPKEVISYLGEVGEDSKAAAHMLTKMGFRYLQQIEPFDGGPYYGTLTREVSLVRAARQMQCFTLHTASKGKLHLILAETGEGIRCLAAPLDGTGARAALSVETARRLSLKAGDWFWAAPLPA